MNLLKIMKKHGITRIMTAKQYEMDSPAMAPIYDGDFIYEFEEKVYADEDDCFPVPELAPNAWGCVAKPVEVNREKLSNAIMESVTENHHELFLESVDCVCPSVCFGKSDTFG